MRIIQACDYVLKNTYSNPEKNQESQVPGGCSNKKHHRVFGKMKNGWICVRNSQPNTFSHLWSFSLPFMQ